MTNTKSTLQRPLALLLGLVLACAACGSSSSDADSTSGQEASSAGATTTSEPVETSETSAPDEEPSEGSVTEFVTLADADPDDNIGLFSIEGADDFVFTMTSCVGEGESTVKFEGQSEAGTSIAVDATDMIGGIFVDGPEGSFEGAVSLVSVGDTGWTTASGEASVADHTDTGGPLLFTVSGFVCK